ncbi:MarR family transcriptional regulator [Desulfosporosinus sp. OT]|uniref:MarR family winged helix-turn-helix transcriptional regulator n=1 Tax=Desulfosporosinus sp. OT TaxID=913865 RepID=UPI000223ACCE|nr:MarR family transcriptional regulator [Desulfosporosinus sp. OT]EGW36204.1 marR family protein [Desulfosporosinus sp. OT]
MNFPTDFADEIANLFKSIHKTYHDYILSQVACHNFTVPQLMVLHELYHHPEITLTELSERVDLTKSTVCGIVNRLELHGAVKKVKVSEDRRIVRISLTEEVSAVQEKLDAIRKNYLAELFKNTDPEDLEKILYGFKLLNNVMKNFQPDEHCRFK